MNFDDHKLCLERLKKAQEADHDNRERAREAHAFVDTRGGQWEQKWWETNDGKPRYTFDLVNPIIDQVAGDIERQDFDISVSPAGGDASEDVAEVYDGIVRNIENISDAVSVYNTATRNAIIGGIDGWRVTQRYVDDNSFDQDLIIEKIPNFIDRVWFGVHENDDASDATHAWVLTGVDPDVFKEKYPDRSESASVEQDRSGNVHFHRNDLVMVGEFIYLKEEKRELVLMSNGHVYESDELVSVADELAQLGVTEVRRRERKLRKVFSRLFDNDGWITDPRETVFENWLPVIPCYANFKLFEDKVTYWGAVEKLIDPQRVYNYSLSREIEEGALAPRAKYWMTEKQAIGYEDSLETLNTNSDPVQFYNPDPEAPGAPQQNGGAQVNPGLRTISEAMRDIVGQSAGMFAANMGDNPGLQSGIAIEALQDRGDTGNNKYTLARERAQRHTARILVNAIPRVYTEGRSARLLKQDGSIDMKVIAQPVQDMQTGQVVMLHDLTQGAYDVTCSSGPSFKSRQNETVKALTEIGAVDPSVIQLGGDVLLGNITSPGMEQIAERKRQELFKMGIIPPEQLTDQEREQLQQMQSQPPPEDPNMVLAKAEEAKAQADILEAQTEQAKAQSEIEARNRKLEIDAYKAATERMRLEVEAQKAQAEIAHTAEKTQRESVGTGLDVQRFEKELRTESTETLLRLVSGG